MDTEALEKRINRGWAQPNIYSDFPTDELTQKPAGGVK